MLSCSLWFSAPSFWKGGGLDSRCVGRVDGADGAVHIIHIYIYIYICVCVCVCVCVWDVRWCSWLSH